jgi:hypothetical protein
MKYFTLEYYQEGWEMWGDDKTEEERLEIEKRHSLIFEEYLRELENLKHRVGKRAWEFFRYGRGEYGLHDGRLLSFCVGDGLDYVPDGSSPFLINRQETSAKIEFLNYEQNFHYTFSLLGVGRVQSNIFADKEMRAESIGDLMICELTAVDENYLQLGFPFASGTSIVIQFQRLIFKRRQIKRQYEVGEMYRIRRRKA